MKLCKGQSYSKIKLLYDLSTELNFHINSVVYSENDKIDGIYLVKKGDFI